MLKNFINWWRKITKYTPPKETIEMTDQECMDEYTKLWDDFMVFNLEMTNRDVFRMNVLENALIGRGYDILGTTVGIKFEKRK